MRPTHPTVMGPKQPALEQRDHPVDPREQLGGQGVVSPQGRHPVVIPVGLQVGVAVPAIGVHAAARLDGLGDERLERLGGSIGDTGHPNAPDAAAHLFGRDHDQGFRRGRPPARAPEPAHQGLVDLDLPGEPIPPWAHHGPAQLVQPRPGGLIAPQAQDLRQAQGAGPRSSDWSRTTSPGTTSSGGRACRRRWCPP